MYVLLFIVWLTLSNDSSILCFLLFVEMHERSSAGQGSPCKYLLLSRPYSINSYQHRKTSLLLRKQSGKCNVIQKFVLCITAKIQTKIRICFCNL